ncbi:MAG: hypothetical protein IJ572_01070 [Bacilli bacterium]|nr:hypothetical protein [Bacilli bacterium]
MSKSTRNETKEKLYQLRLALEYAKMALDEEKIKILKTEIEEVRDKLKKEALEQVRKGR